MNKKLIAILTLVMFAITLLPMGAFAATKNATVGSIPTIVTAKDYTGLLPDLRIDEDLIGNIASGDVLQLTLPSGTEFTAAPTLTRDPATLVGDYELGGTFTLVGDQQARITFTRSTDAKKQIIRINLPVEVTTVGTGDLNVTVSAPGTAITSGEVTVARFASSGVSVRALDTKTRGEGTHYFGTVELIENAAGAIEAGTGKKIELQAPTGFTFIDPTTESQTLPSATRGLTFGSATYGNRKLEIPVTNPSTTGPSIVTIPVVLQVDSNASLGEIELSLGGEISGTIILGKYADFGVTVSAEEAKELVAGEANQKLADFKIKEDVSESLISNRTVRITLPEGVRFNPAFTANITSDSTGKADSSAAGLKSVTVNDDRTELTYTLGTATGKTEMKFNDFRVDVSPRYRGEVEVKVSGNAGATGEVLVANVEAPITVTAEAADIIVGVQKQKLADLYIKENKKDIFDRNKTITLTLGNGLGYSTTPKVEVVEGNAEVKSVTRDKGVVTITFDSSGTKLSTIKVYGQEVTVDRSVPEGNVDVTVAGSAVFDVKSVPASINADDFYVDAITIGEGATLGKAVDAWDITKNVGAYKVATVVTPAGDNVVKPVVMTVGSTVYTIDGVEMTMDVAPYIKDARTYFPVRHVAQALGITTDNVVWDNAQRTVTIFRGNRIVQVTIGSRTMLVNGVPLTMDVAPEITADRTMLPIRFVAQGLGVNVDWDDATRTITLN